MNCTSCGAALPDGAAFCPECGAAKVGMAPAPGMSGATGPSPASTEPEKDSDGKTLGRVWTALRSALSR